MIDLNGYSDMQRLPLFALRPSPVAIGWFNMYATTGMSGFDYLIGDEHVIPAEEERFYSEKILRVPGSYLTFRRELPRAAGGGGALPCDERDDVRLSRFPVQDHQ